MKINNGFIEFDSVFTESKAPEVKEFCKLSSIDRVHINTAKDDPGNEGDYYVWLVLSSGEDVPCFRGTLQECKDQYEIIKSNLIGWD